MTIPHLGASTAESEDNCAVMAAHELDDFLRYGNIKNSVNFPNVSMAHTAGATRVCLFHRNIPSLITQISGVLSEQGINIENLINRSKGNNAYTLVETEAKIGDEIKKKLESFDGMVRVTVI